MKDFLLPMKSSEGTLRDSLVETGDACKEGMWGILYQQTFHSPVVLMEWIGLGGLDMSSGV